MKILNLKDYKIEVYNKVKEKLMDSYHQERWNRYACTDEEIKNIIEYFANKKYIYNVKTGVTTLDGEFCQCYSYKSDIPPEGEAVGEFIWTATHEILNAIQNPYFDNATCKYDYNKKVYFN